MTAFLGYRRVLLVTAVAVERDAVLAGLRITGSPDHRTAEPAAVVVVVAGVGPAATAAATASVLAIAALRGEPFDAVLCAGIGGGFAGRVHVGGVALATCSIAADLGAESPEGFLSLTALGFGTPRHDVDPVLLGHLAARLPGAVTGAILTVSTATGSAATADALRSRCPEAVAEGMEGFGVAQATREQPGVAQATREQPAVAQATREQPGVAFGELRAISNVVGPRDRSAWRVPQALDALRDAFAALARF